VRWRLTDPGQVALTFDDGPHPEGTRAVLEALDGAGAAATFFVLLDAVRAHPEVLAEVVAAGHAVGLHADVHERLDRQPARALARRLVDARHELEDHVGSPVSFHRPPFGRLSLSGARAANRAGMEIVLWSHDPRDWEDPLGLDSRIEASLAPGAVVLLHDGAITYEHQGAATAAALRRCLGPGRARRFELVPLTDRR
jgi:peptidoglycan/xylan/chitin deacetylase (PgdA/CDA1 family)